VRERSSGGPGAEMHRGYPADPPAYRSGLGSEGAGPSGLIDGTNRKGGVA
jgi:hypothetical protein